MVTPFTEDEFRCIHGMRRSGMPYVAIAKDLGMSASKCCHAYKRMCHLKGIAPLGATIGFSWTPELEDACARLRREGSTLEEIRHAVGAGSIATVRRKLKKLGIPKPVRVFRDQSGETPEKAPALQSDWPEGWSQMTRRNFCRYRDSGRTKEDVARMLRVSLREVESLWSLSAPY